MNDPGERIEFPHYPVLYNEIIHALSPTRGGHYVDGTVGAGGHARGILLASSPDGRLLGLDLDPQAVDLARRRLEAFGTRAVILQASYTSLDEQISRPGLAVGRWNCARFRSFYDAAGGIRSRLFFR